MSGQRPPQEAPGEHQAGFLAMIDGAFRRYGVSGGLAERMRDAVAVTPRHRFVHRFRLQDEAAVRDFDADPEPLWKAVYSDAVMIPVDGADAALPSSNSQPSYVLWLLHRLGIAPGERVLEIGSGSGWLAAVMGRLVGDTGAVTGIEIIPQLAECSRADLAGLGIGNVTVFNGDGTLAVEGGPFDRVIVTAATWDVTDDLLGNVAEDGRLLVPIGLRGGGCEVAVLRREGTRLVAESSTPGFFVPLVGRGQPGEIEAEPLDAVLAGRGIDPASRASWSFPLGRLSDAFPGAAPWAFASYLRQCEPGFFRIADGSGRLSATFALADGTRSLAVCRDGSLEAYGGRTAAARLVRAYLRWADLGMPGPDAFALTIVRAGDAPKASETVHVEHRCESALVRRLKPGVDAWRALIDES